MLIEHVVCADVHRPFEEGADGCVLEGEGVVAAVAFIAFERHIADMTASVRSSSGKEPPRSSTTISTPERTAAARIVSLLSSAPAKGRGLVEVVGAEGQRVEVPTALAEIMYRAAELIAEGHPVAVMSDEEILSTQEAADLLNMSRQYLVRLVDAGELPARKVGSHRRLRLVDVLTFKARRDAKRASALDRLAALSEDVGGYELDDKSQ
ncbi:helix-turn-helix domain-containing protein [Inquilinus sp. CA228]|uniref:helix-turn-helix domain-containing protein n=1 Tax=Inquilinus sp. CA228 TaxID=3455609 RepID=UPI003F8D00E5